MDKRGRVHNAVDVIEGELDLGAGLLPSSLLRGAAGKDADDARPPVGEDGLNSTAESCAVGKQENDGRDAPRHSEHGESGAAPVVTHGAIGLGK
jgi:hypothetical protein